MSRGRRNDVSKRKQSKKGGDRTESAPPTTITKELMRAKNINATVLILRNFLSSRDISSLRRLGPLGTHQNHDRSDELDFEHVVYRFEAPLRDGDGDLHDRLLNAMFAADEELWRGVPAAGSPARDRLHPEIEFISYDADEARRSERFMPYIGPHVDNASAVTLIGMLSQFRDDDKAAIKDCGSGSKGGKKGQCKRNYDGDRGYEGGFNRFEVGGADFGRDAEDGGIASGAYRETRLNRGDVLLFRGEMLEHSLTSVTAGLRQIVQIELCREKEGRH